MIYDRGKASFDKESWVKGSNESKTTGFDLQGLENSGLGLLSQLHSLWQYKPKLRVVHWFSSQQVKERPEREQNCSILAQFLFYLYVALHFLSSNEGIKNLIICATRSLRSRAPLAKTLQQAISKNYFLHTNVLSYLWTMVDLTQTSPCTEAVQYGLPEKHDRTRGRLRKQLHTFTRPLL